MCWDAANGQSGPLPRSLMAGVVVFHSEARSLVPFHFSHVTLYVLLFPCWTFWSLIFVSAIRLACQVQTRPKSIHPSVNHLRVYDRDTLEFMKITINGTWRPAAAASWSSFGAVSILMDLDYQNMGFVWFCMNPYESATDFDLFLWPLLSTRS